MALIKSGWTDQHRFPYTLARWMLERHPNDPRRDTLVLCEAQTRECVEYVTVVCAPTIRNFLALALMFASGHHGNWSEPTKTNGMT